MAEPKDVIKVNLDIETGPKSSVTVSMTRAEYDALCKRIDSDGPVELGGAGIDPDAILELLDLEITQAEEA